MSNSNLIQCRICKKYFKSVSTHVFRTHKMSFSDYKTKFNLTNEDCYPKNYLEDCSNKIKGKNNPGYQHGGKLSPFSKKSVSYKDKSEDEIEYILKKYDKDRSIKLKTGGKLTSQKEYWLNLGFSEEDSIKRVSERQSTFTLDKCKEKHGGINGTVIWQERQNKWQNTLNSKSQGEIDEMNFKKSRWIDFNDIIDKIEKEFKILSECQKESFSFEYWISKIFLGIDKIVKNIFDNNIENLYNKISDDIKKSFKNNKKIFKHTGKYCVFNMYTDKNELLRSSYEINFYLLLNENNIEYIYEKQYPNSKMKYDFYLPKYDLYIEIAGMMIHKNYQEKMIKKHKDFNAGNP